MHAQTHVCTAPVQDVAIAEESMVSWFSQYLGDGLPVKLPVNQFHLCEKPERGRPQLLISLGRRSWPILAIGIRLLASNGVCVGWGGNGAASAEHGHGRTECARGRGTKIAVPRVNRERGSG